MIRWSYAINQWKPQFDDFTRRRQHERALRVIAVSGFSGVELTTGTGRWEPLGNPQQIEANFGTLDGFASFVTEAGLSGVSSWFWDPFVGFQEDLTDPTDPADPAARDLLVRHAVWFATALARLGGTVLVVRPAASAWQVGPLDDAALGEIAATWNAVGEAVQGVGVGLALHFDFLSSLRVADGFETLLARTDPQLVGVALDTAELTVSGVDPLAFLERHHQRVVHVHLKNAGAVDDGDEFLTRNAEHHVRRSGGARRVPRWFLELETEPVLVDSAAVVAALRRHDYDGWVVVESDLTPHPATSTMLNGWYVQTSLDQ